MRKVDDGKRKKKRKEKKKKKRKEKNGVFSGHYVIASSLPPVRLRPNDDRWNAARSCQFPYFLLVKKCFTLTSASLLLSVATSLLILWYSWLVSSMVSSFSLTLSCSLLLSLSLVSSITTFFSSSSLDSLIALRHWLYELLERYNHIFLLSAKTWLILKLWYPVFFFNIAKLSPSRNSS